jgi:hypothetical protein
MDTGIQRPGQRRSIVITRGWVVADKFAACKDHATRRESTLPVQIKASDGQNGFARLDEGRPPRRYSVRGRRGLGGGRAALSGHRKTRLSAGITRRSGQNEPGSRPILEMGLSHFYHFASWRRPFKSLCRPRKPRDSSSIVHERTIAAKSRGQNLKNFRMPVLPHPARLSPGLSFFP